MSFLGGLYRRIDSWGLIEGSRVRRASREIVQQSLADILDGVQISANSAEDRARRMLWDMLEPLQKYQYQALGMFEVKTRGMGTAVLVNGALFWRDLRNFQCVGPCQATAPGRQREGQSWENMPITDTVIAQLFHLRTNPRRLFEVGVIRPASDIEMMTIDGNVFRAIAYA